ncbi:carboxylesterase family protein [Solidesulfovibrio sp.]
MLPSGSTPEGTAYLRGERDLGLGKYDAFLKARFPSNASEALALFPAANDADVVQAIDRCISVAANAQPARFVARAMERVQTKAYLYYRFTRRPDTTLARELGAFHGVDLAYVFGNMADADGYKGADRELSRQVMAYWVNFARTGDPNGPDLVVWPVYAAASDTNLNFAGKVSVERHLYEKA